MPVETTENLRIRTAAAFLGITEGAVRYAVHQKRLRLIEDEEGTKRIPKEDLERYKQETQPDGKPRSGRPKGVKDSKKRSPRKPRKESTE